MNVFINGVNCSDKCFGFCNGEKTIGGGIIVRSNAKAISMEANLMPLVYDNQPMTGINAQTGISVCCSEDGKSWYNLRLVLPRDKFLYSSKILTKKESSYLFINFPIFNQIDDLTVILSAEPDEVFYEVLSPKREKIVVIGENTSAGIGVTNQSNSISNILVRIFGYDVYNLSTVGKLLPQIDIRMISSINPSIIIFECPYVNNSIEESKEYICAYIKDLEKTSLDAKILVWCSSVEGSRLLEKENIGNEQFSFVNIYKDFSKMDYDTCFYSNRFLTEMGHIKIALKFNELLGGYEYGLFE